MTARSKKPRKPLIGFSADTPRLSVRASMVEVITTPTAPAWRVRLSQTTTSDPEEPTFCIAHYEASYWMVEPYATEAAARKRIYALLRAFQDVAPHVPITKIREERQ